MYRDEVDQVSEEKLEGEAAGGEKEIIHRMQMDLHNGGADQQHREEEQERHRRKERNARRDRTRIEHRWHVHADPLRADHIRITPIELPFSIGLLALGWRASTRRKIDLGEVRLHGQMEIPDARRVAKRIGPAISAA